MATTPNDLHPYKLTATTVLGRPIEVVDPVAEVYEVGYRVISKRATYDLVHLGCGVFQPRNSLGKYCAIAGNYFFWVSRDGHMSCGTRDQFRWDRAEDRREVKTSAVLG